MKSEVAEDSQRSQPEQMLGRKHYKSPVDESVPALEERDKDIEVSKTGTILIHIY